MKSEALMFLAHFSGDGLAYWLEQPGKDCYYWYNEAVKVYHEMNKSKEE
jgi:hypothetical protein